MNFPRERKQRGNERVERLGAIIFSLLSVPLAPERLFKHPGAPHPACY